MAHLMRSTLFLNFLVLVCIRAAHADARVSTYPLTVNARLTFA